MGGITKKKITEVDFSDPLFDSIRNVYPAFDEWVEKISAESASERYAFVFLAEGSLAGIAVVKQHEGDSGLSKLCSFKVAEEFAGEGFGSLLLDRVLGEVKRLGSDGVIVEFFPSQLRFQRFVKKHLFKHEGTTISGELRYIRYL